MAAIPDASAEESAVVGEQIRQAIADYRFIREGIVLRPGISIGVAPWRTPSDLAKVRRMTARPLEKTVEIAGIKLRYLEAGDGPAVLFLHGAVGVGDLPRGLEDRELAGFVEPRLHGLEVLLESEDAELAAIA